jgi:acyl transferase domain-containing protein/phosphopantetheinyl transferase
MTKAPLFASTEPEDIAVVGVACLFPGAGDVATYWRNILGKVDAVTDPPPEAWDSSLYYDPNVEENDRVYCKKGGYLGRLAYFDPLEHGIMPRAVQGGEPDQWLALRVAREAMRDAGLLDASTYRERAALILGKGNYANRGTLSVVQHGIVVDYTLGLLKSIHPELTEHDLRLIRADLKRHLPRFDSETAPSLIANVTVGRIANRLDIMGPSYTVDAACASSLLAIDIASKGLRSGEYDMALVGGLQAATALPVLGLFCQLKALSLTERIRPFDKDADGTILSEGVGMAVLKRRSQAERDGDRIYAFVKGSGVASDGRAVGVLAPRIEGEELALRRAYVSADIEPGTIGLIEAHGTGTLVGDAVEVEALARVFGERTRAPHCALGSVKSMIGHTMPAAGMAGFIKAVLSLYYKVLPPTLNVSEPNPRLGLERTPFYINTETRPWIHGDPVHPRRAGVNSFGFGGINAHVVLEEAPGADRGPTFDTNWDTEVCLFTGATRDDILSLGRRVAGVLARDPAAALADVAHSLNMQRRVDGGSSTTLGIVARSTEDLACKLERALTRLADPECLKLKDAGGIYFFAEPLARDGNVAFVFPGEGSQYVNMLSDLSRHFPTVRGCFDEMDRVQFDHPRGYRVSELVFPPPAFNDVDLAAAERRLMQMDVAVESVTAANRAIYLLLQELGIVPDVILGHSTGEYGAMRVAGMLDEANYDQRIVELNDNHGRAASASELPGDARLIAIGAERAQVESLCASIGLNAVVAMDNCPHQVVLMAGATTAPIIEARLRAEGLLYNTLAFDRPYHTPDFEPFARSLRDILRRSIIRPPSIPLYSCTSAAPYPSNVSEAQDLAYEHWVRPVEFRKTIRRMWDDGVRIFVESGPRGNLTAFIEDILSGRPFAAIAANVSRRTGLAQLHHLIAQLAAHGVSMNLAPLYERRQLRTIDWAPHGEPPVRSRSLGRVKLPTGAQEMHFSPETIELVRARTSPPVRSAAPVAAAAAARASVDQPAPAAPTRPVPAAAERNLQLASATATMPLIAPASAIATSAVPVAVAEAHSSGPFHVMSSYLQTMERFLAIEHSLVTNSMTSVNELSAIAEPAASLSTNVRPGLRLPLVDVVDKDGRQLVAHCALDVDQQPFLRDHTIGRNVSGDDPFLTGFPIVPFTAMMEIMAETATALAPGLLVIGMREVRVHRWLAVDQRPLELEITAAWNDEGQVGVRVLDLAAPEMGPVADGCIVLGSAYPTPPEAPTLRLRDEGVYKWKSDRLYEEAMFHGPLFRGVRSIDRVGENGAEATLSVGDREPLLAPQMAEGLVTDFVLLDQPGQVVGFWTSQYLERGFVVLPFRMGALHLYGPSLRAGEQVMCRAQIALVGEHQVRSDLDVIDADGHVWARFEEWEDRRFDLPDVAFAALLRPLTTRLSHESPFIQDTDGPKSLTAFRIGLDSFPRGWLTAHGGLWLRVLGALTLSRRERDLWYGMKAVERRRIEWLVGRIAAKDAVRDFVLRQWGLALHPADVEIVPDATGQPTVTGAWTSQVPRLPLISISHVEGTAIAVVTDSDGISGVGVDLERHGRMKPGMETVSFTARERAMLDGFDGDDWQAWALRLWCAKEAASKATGGEVGSLSAALAIEHIDKESGEVLVRCTSPNGDSETLFASTFRDGDWIIATCIR